MRNEIKISIIIPVYNSQAYLQRCLESCLRQTFSDMEIIIVNDCSTDDSYLIMKHYEKTYSERIRCINLPENIRQGGARNAGLRLAQGKFVMFVDSDDWIQPKMCEILYNEAIKEQAEIVYCDVLRETTKGYVINNRFPKELVGIVDEGKISELVTQLYVGPCAHIIRKEIIVDNNLFFPEKLIYEDMAITRLWDVYAHKISKVDEPLYVYCLNSGSTGQQPIVKYMNDGFQCVKILNNNLKVNNLTRKFDEERIIICLHYTLEVAESLARKLPQKCYPQIQKDFDDCVKSITNELNKSERWNCWFHPLEQKWLTGKQKLYDRKQLEEFSAVKCFEEYYNNLRQKVSVVFEWFLQRGKTKALVWENTFYGQAFRNEFTQYKLTEQDVKEIDDTMYIIVLRSLHCSNALNNCNKKGIFVFNMQGYLFGEGDIQKYVLCSEKTYYVIEREE